MKKQYLILFVPCVAFALSGCGRQSSTASPSNPGVAQPTSSSAEPAAPVVAPESSAAPVAKAAQQPHPVTIYTVNTANGKDSNDYLVPQQVAVTDAQDPAREAVNDLLSASNTPIAPGTRLLGIKISDGAADVDFSQVPVDQDQGEESQEQALTALQKTLGQFPDIKTIHVLVHGKTPSSLGEAAGGDLTVIRPNQPDADTAGV